MSTPGLSVFPSIPNSRQGFYEQKHNEPCCNEWLATTENEKSTTKLCVPNKTPHITCTFKKKGNPYRPVIGGSG